MGTHKVFPSSSPGPKRPGKFSPMNYRKMGAKVNVVDAYKPSAHPGYGRNSEYAGKGEPFTW
jgi:hypothetical protein